MFKLTIQFCGAWGYGRHYYRVVAALYEDEGIGDDIEVSPIHDKGRTGNFEVRVESTGEILFSKKTMNRHMTSEDIESVKKRLIVLLSEQTSSN